MKIGILTLPLHNNYGGNLQAYALLVFLRKLGCVPTLIRLKPAKRKFIEKTKICIEQFIKRYLFFQKTIGNPFLVEIPKNDAEMISRNSMCFIKKYIQPQTTDVHSLKGLEWLDLDEFDAFVVGSDQVWRKEYAKEYIGAFFLDFPIRKGVKKIAYAASFGKKEWLFSRKETKRFSELAKKFNAISIREDFGVKLCLDHFGVQAEHVLDPTLLLEKEDYLKLITEESAPTPQGNMLVYMLDRTPEKEAILKEVEKTCGVVPITVTAASNKKSDNIEKRIYPPVADWIKGFVDASYVVTDSFHGCIFAIIFNKPFLAICNEKRGGQRFESLLRLFELEGKMVRSLSEYSDEKVLKQIDWIKVGEILIREKKKSERFLQKSLGLDS